LADIFTNEKASPYRKKDGTIDLRKYMTTKHPTGPASPVPQVATSRSLNFSPIAQAPTTQAQVRVKPQSSRASSRASSRGSIASESSVRGLLTPSQNLTIPNKTNPTPGSAFQSPTKSSKTKPIYPQAPFSSPKPPTKGESILEQTQKSSYTPQNTEFITKCKKTKARSSTPASESSILDTTLNVLSGGMLGSAKKSTRRESSMLSEATTKLPGQLSHTPAYKKGYYTRRLEVLKSTKGKPFNKDTDMNDDYNKGYYGKISPNTFEQYVNRTPPPRQERHGNKGNQNARRNNNNK
jgi:hypothetical protein